MEPESIGVLAAFALAVIVILIYRKGQKARLREAKSAYDAALKSGDKMAAVTAGRNYYKILRGNKLTTSDELAITNDLATMKDNFRSN